MANTDYRMLNLVPAQTLFAITLFIVYLGALNWLVVAVRQSIDRKNREIPDAFTWLTYWGQTALYYVVGIFAIIFSIMIIVAYLRPEKVNLFVKPSSPVKVAS